METTLTGSRLYDRSGNIDKAKIYQVQESNLSSIVDEYVPDGREYVLISDIEGAEADIFYKDIYSLSRCKIIICELENANSHPIEGQIQLLQSAGFELVEHYGQVYVFKRKHCKF